MASKPLDILITCMSSDLSAFRFGQEAGLRYLRFAQTHYHELGPNLAGLPRGIDAHTRWLPRRPMATNDITDNHFGVFARLTSSQSWGRVLDQGLYAQELMSLDDKIGKRWVIEQAGLRVAKLVDPKAYSWRYPVIARKRYAGRSKANYLLSSQSDWQEFQHQHNQADFCFERFYELVGDYRVLLIGNKVLGVLRREVHIKAQDKRIVVKGVGSTQLPQRVLAQCVHFSQVIGADFLGIDIGKRRDGSYFFIEYNFSPQFLGFERETGVNAAGAVIDFLMA
jgi:hypothetical protein